MNARPGGRIHSLRKMGPKKDLVVEAWTLSNATLADSTFVL